VHVGAARCAVSEEDEGIKSARRSTPQHSAAQHSASKKNRKEEEEEEEKKYKLWHSS